MSQESGVLLALALIGGAVWAWKEHAEEIVILAILIGRILFVLAVIVIGIYCLTRLF